MKVLAVIDSFKGTLSSERLNKITAEELEKKGHFADCIPISDGGEGFLDAIGYIFPRLEKVKTKVHDPLFELTECAFLYDRENKTAYLETALSSGLGLLRKEELNPLSASSYGLGETIEACLTLKVRKIVVGIGGSAVVDGGAGMLEALGVCFYDKDNKPIRGLCNRKLGEISKIDDGMFRKRIKGKEFVILSDVGNELLGPSGAVYVYAPQKGATKEELPVLESNLFTFSSFRPAERTAFGSGAAGGIGYAFRAYFGAEFYSGIDYLLDLLSFDELVKGYDRIVTGEGKIDKQTFSGKAVSKIISRCHDKNRIICVAAICELDEKERKKHHIDNLHCVVKKNVGKEDSLRNPEYYYRLMIEKEVL